MYMKGFVYKRNDKGKVVKEFTSEKFEKIAEEDRKKKISIANTGKKRSKEMIQKMSSSTTSTGFYRLYKHNDKRVKQGFTWSYVFYENGKRKSISSVDFKELIIKMKKKNYNIEITNKEIAEKTLKELDLKMKDILGD